MAVEVTKGRGTRRQVQYLRGLAADRPAVGSAGLEEGDVYSARDGGAGARISIYTRNAADNAFEWVGLV